MKITGIRILCAFSVTDAVRLWEIICTVKERVIQRSAEKRNSQMHQSTWGNHWYESDRQFEVLLGDTEDIEIHVDSLVTGRHLVEPVSLKGMPDRKNYALRLKISTFFSDEKTCHIIFEDMGFGEFFAPSGFRLEKIIELGGSNGQFNSLS